MRTGTIMLTAILLGGALAFSACARRAAEGPTAAAIERAESGVDHALIAEQYEQEAAELRGKVAECQARLRAYENKPFHRKVHHRRSYDAAVNHCQKLIENYTQAAVEAEAMAREHRELATTEPQ